MSGFKLSVVATIVFNIILAILFNILLGYIAFRFINYLF